MTCASARPRRSNSRAEPAIRATSASALNATHLIEGSVRKDGDRCASPRSSSGPIDGAHLWTETYDRQLTDIFAIQEEIAQAIAGALRVPLGLRQGDNLLRSRTTDPETYQLYLGAKSCICARIAPGPAIRWACWSKLSPAIPIMRPPWRYWRGLTRSAYSTSHRHSIGRSRNPAASWRQLFRKPKSAARRAIELDPDLADGYAALAAIQGVRGEYLPSEELYLKALALDPDSPDALHDYSGLLAGVGRLKEAVAMKQRLLRA